MLVFNTLAPVFLLIGLGALLERIRFVSPGFLKEANRVTYWVGLPALLFSQLASSFHDGSGAQSMLVAMGIATALVVVAGYAAGWLLRIPSTALGTFVQGAFRGNLAFIGLPIIYALPDTVLAGGISARAAAVVVIAPMMVAYNLIGVVVLLLSQHELGWKMLRPFFKQLLTTPPLLATLAGIGFALAGWKLPHAVDQTFAALGEMAMPLGLLGVGGSIVAVDTRAHGRGAWGAALLKTALSPFLGWALGRALGLGPVEMKIIMIFMAAPTAIISYTMALELKGDEAIASGSIVISVLTSIVSLAIIVGFF